MKISDYLNKFSSQMNNFKKHFSSTTTTGRANVAKATYASIAVIYLYYRIFKKTKPAKKIEEPYQYNPPSIPERPKCPQTDSCPSYSQPRCVDPRDRRAQPNPFPDQPPSACPPSCQPQPPPELPPPEGQCTCRYINEREPTDTSKRKRNPFLSDTDEDEIW